MNKIIAMSPQLYATGLLGGLRRRVAIRKLARTPGKEPLMALVDALGKKHPNEILIIEHLKKLSPDKDGELIEALWRVLAKKPQPSLAAVLTKLGWPTGHNLDHTLAKSLLALITDQVAPEILSAIEQIAKIIPANDDATNDSLYTAWVISHSKILEKLLGENYRPGSPTLETLYAIVTGRISRYEALHDHDTDLITQAVKLASAEFLDRMARVVAISGNQPLHNAYRTALFRAKINIEQRLAHLKLIGDEVGLFEQIPGLCLSEVLNLCERWSARPDWSTDPRQKAVLTQALEAYKTITSASKPSGPALPDNMVDIFTYWRENSPENNIKYNTNNPFMRARAIYLDSINSNKSVVLDKKHWLERLVSSLINSNNITELKDDAVCWLSACANDITLLKTPIVGNPNDYLQHKNLLQSTNNLTTRHLALMVILCTFQAVFIGPDITIETLREPKERTAIRIENFIKQ